MVEKFWYPCATYQIFISTNPLLLCLFISIHTTNTIYNILLFFSLFSNALSISLLKRCRCLLKPWKGQAASTNTTRSVIRIFRRMILILILVSHLLLPLGGTVIHRKMIPLTGKKLRKTLSKGLWILWKIWRKIYRSSKFFLLGFHLASNFL